MAKSSGKERAGKTALKKKPARIPRGKAKKPVGPSKAKQPSSALSKKLRKPSPSPGGIARFHILDAPAKAIERAILKARSGGRDVAVVYISSQAYDDLTRNPESARPLDALGIRLQVVHDIPRPAIAAIGQTYSEDNVIERERTIEVALGLQGSGRALSAAERILRKRGEVITAIDLSKGLLALVMQWPGMKNNNQLGLLLSRGRGTSVKPRDPVYTI